MPEDTRLKQYIPIGIAILIIIVTISISCFFKKPTNNNISSSKSRADLSEISKMLTYSATKLSAEINNEPDPIYSVVKGTYADAFLSIAKFLNEGDINSLGGIRFAELEKMIQQQRFASIQKFTSDPNRILTFKFYS